MIDFEPTDEQRQLVDLLHTFVRREIDPLEDQIDTDAAELPAALRDPLYTKAEQTGLRRLDVPEEYGGLGLDMVTRALLTLEISQHRAGIYAPCYGAFTGFSMAQLYDGTDDQKERFLYPTLAGEMQPFFALSEPSGGSDPSRAIQTRATRTGTSWTISGTKLWIGGADRADYGLVFARTSEGSDGITCFIVEVDRPGFQIARIVHTMRSAKPTAEIHLDEVVVPDENRLGEVGGGFRLARDRLSRERVPYAALSLGPAIRAHEMAVEWAKIREVFGKPLAEHQGIQWMLVDSEIELRTARLFILEAAARIDRGAPFQTESSLAKMVATEAASRVVDRSMQVHGALGVSKDLPFERWYRELRIRRIAEGPTEAQRMVLAKAILGRR